MRKSNTMTRDELFARVEVLKLAHVCEPHRSPKAPAEIVADFNTLWASVLPDGREMDCGCHKKDVPKPTSQTFTGTHVVPFSWVGSPDKGYKLYVMDFPLFTLTLRTELNQGNKQQIIVAALERDGYDTRIFTGEDGTKNAMQFANDELVRWLNANVEAVQGWLAAKSVQAEEVPA